MLAKKIKEGIYWVGAIDWNIRSFHGYSTTHGTTYNAYLIIDDKITLIDTVLHKFSEELIARISSIIDPTKIDIIISNHGEPDHSSSLLEVMKFCPNAKIYSSTPNGVKILNALYGELPIEPVKSGDSLSIGKRTLKFIHAPMVHWPDNMVTYSEKHKILFSNDVFGQHFASSHLFDGECDLPTILSEAKKYYANIVLPYTNQAFKATNVLKDFNIDIIATGHGIIWRDHVKEIIKLYNSMTTSKKEDKAIVVFDTMWGSTEKIAKAITEAFRNKDIKVRLYNINNTHESDIVAELMDSKYLAVGSSTLNNNLLPTIASFLSYIKGLSPVGIKYIAFGSYGWGGQSVQLIDQELKSMKLESLIPPIKQLYSPKEEQLRQIQSDIINSLE